MIFELDADKDNVEHAELFKNYVAKDGQILGAIVFSDDGWAPEIRQDTPSRHSMVLEKHFPSTDYV